MYEGESLLRFVVYSVIWVSPSFRKYSSYSILNILGKIQSVLRRVSTGLHNSFSPARCCTLDDGCCTLDRYLQYLKTEFSEMTSIPVYHIDLFFLLFVLLFLYLLTSDSKSDGRTPTYADYNNDFFKNPFLLLQPG